MIMIMVIMIIMMMMMIIIIAFDIGSTQHNLGFAVVLKVDLLWYSFRRTPAFSASS